MCAKCFISLSPPLPGLKKFRVLLAPNKIVFFCVHFWVDLEVKCPVSKFETKIPSTQHIMDGSGHNSIFGYYLTLRNKIFL